MDAKKAMKIVYNIVKRGKDLSAEDTSITISPKDFKGKLSGTDLWRSVHKMSQDYELFIIVSSPSATTAHEYDDINDLLKPSEEKNHRYVLHTCDEFDDFPNKILKESMPINNPPEYMPYYIKLMFQIIDEFNINENNQPAKKEIVAWLNDYYPDLSGNDVKALCTFVRSPEMKKGGWHLNKKRKKKTA